MAAEGEMAGDTCVPRQAGCAAYSPCLVADAAAVQKVAVKTFCAALDRRFVHEQMMLAYGKPAHHCLKDNETLARKGVTSAALLRDSGATLRITGPVSDGFWVRALVVMAHTTWARRIGLPVSVAYRSAQDAYLDQRDERRDGWTQFFEPISARRTDSIWASPVESLGKHMRTASGGSSGPLVQLDCFAAARAWEAYSNYAPNFRAATLQRRQRIEMVRQLPLVPRRVFRLAADTFWQQHGLDGPGGTLGIHLRGTDKPGGLKRGAKVFTPLVRAFLCHRPRARVFVATDDAGLLAELQASVAEWLPPSRLVWGDALRGNSSLNPGFDAKELSLHGHPNLASDVLLDTLLLSKCDFLLKSISSVSEFAIYWNPKLHDHSFDVQLKGQPLPSWADRQCEKPGDAGGGAATAAASEAVVSSTAEDAADAIAAASIADGIAASVSASIASSSASSSAAAPPSPTPIPLAVPSEITLAVRTPNWRSSPTCPRVWVDPSQKLPFRMGSLPNSQAAKLVGAPSIVLSAGGGGSSSAVAGSGTIGLRAGAGGSTALPEADACVRRGEQGAFVAQCAATIGEMDESLSRLRGRRGLFIEYVGRSVWGLGHVLSLAYTLHHICRRLRRYCYIKLWDSQLDELFGYANGQRWTPHASELAKYAESTTIEHTGQEAHSVAALYERVRNESTPLVHVRQVMSTPLLASEAIPWNLPLVAPLVADPARATVATQPYAVTSTEREGSIDRCFCRYVTQPTFGPAGAAVLAESERRVLAASGGGLAVHLRTGLADVADHDLWRVAAQKSDAANSGGRPARDRAVSAKRQGITAQWLYAACSDEALRKLPAALVLSDAPGLTALLLAAYPQMHAVDRLALERNATNTAPLAILSGMSARSWSNGFAPKLAAAVDVAAAGVASEMLVSRYSSMLKPAVARSMCTRRVSHFAEKPARDAQSGSSARQKLCPQFDVVFLRNLQVLTANQGKYACTQQQLVRHPCKGLSGNACRDSFITAMI